MKLTQSGSLWGNIYRLRHYRDGVQISRAEFERLWAEHNLTPEMGVSRGRQTSKFTIDWEVA